MAENDRTIAIVGVVAVVALLGFLAFIIVQQRRESGGGTMSVVPQPNGGFTILDRPN